MALASYIMQEGMHYWVALPGEGEKNLPKLLVHNFMIKYQAMVSSNFSLEIKVTIVLLWDV